jgi:hypothetical protein
VALPAARRGHRRRRAPRCHRGHQDGAADITRAASTSNRASPTDSGALREREIAPLRARVRERYAPTYRQPSPCPLKQPLIPTSSSSPPQDYWQLTHYSFRPDNGAALATHGMRSPGGAALAHCRPLGSAPGAPARALGPHTSSAHARPPRYRPRGRPARAALPPSPPHPPHVLDASRTLCRALLPRHLCVGLCHLHHRVHQARRPLRPGRPEGERPRARVAVGGRRWVTAARGGRGGGGSSSEQPRRGVPRSLVPPLAPSCRPRPPTRHRPAGAHQPVVLAEDRRGAPARPPQPAGGRGDQRGVVGLVYHGRA